ncbi:MAG: ribonuclease E/G [Eubacteriales bacterium]|nr:ribonuclease E/G [Eubacteriales bacterium]
MKSDILLLKNADGLPEAILLEEGVAIEWLPTISATAAANQDIILGRIESVDRGLQRVFVEIGQPENALLPLKEAPVNCKAGQTILVQIRRLTGGKKNSETSDHAPTKGHLLTTKIQYPGLFLVLDPSTEAGFLRSKTKLLPDVQRTTLVDTERTLLLQQRALAETDAQAGGSVPRLISRLREPHVAALMDWLTPEIQSIQLDDLELFQAVDVWLTARWPEQRAKLRLQAGTFDLRAIHRVSDLARDVSKRRVLLKNGGSIVWDQTEALLAIDVNTGKAQASDNIQLRFKTNQLAAVEIARQLRLRHTDGLVVIDFVRLPNEATRLEFEYLFKAALQADHAKITFGGFTKLGLYELIRQTR